MTEDDRTDEELRRWGAEARAEAPVIRPEVARRTRTRTLGRWPAMLAGAAAIVALAITLLAVRSSDRIGPAGEPPPTAVSTPEPPPPGMQPVTYRHLAILVPSSWTIGDQYCGKPQSDTVLLPTAVLSCLTGSPPGISWAEFSRKAPRLEEAERTSVSVGGHAAQKVTGTHAGLPAVTVDVPDADAAVLITSPDRGLVARLANTVRYVDVDANGCHAEQPYVPLLATPRSEVPDADASLIPGMPTRMSVCAYEGETLAAGVTVSPVDLDADVALLRGLPRGVSLGPDRFTNEGACTDADDPTRALDRDGQWFIILLGYPHGPELVLHVRLGLCGELGVSNGSITGQWSSDLVNLVARSTAVSFSFPPHARPAR